jgi:hypothetical protein
MPMRALGARDGAAADLELNARYNFDATRQIRLLAVERSR